MNLSFQPPEEDDPRDDDQREHAAAPQAQQAAEAMGTFACPVCGKDTPHHHPGVWTLTAPDGRQWHGDSPIKACREEQRSRIPDAVAVERVMQIDAPTAEPAPRMVYNDDGFPIGYAAPNPAEPAQQDTRFHHETWWLIESTVSPRALYYAGPRKGGKPHVVEWVEDAGKAVRFPTEEAAKLTLALMIGADTTQSIWHLQVAGSGYRAAEHIFDYTPLAASQAERPAEGGK